jgi:hypothetical protein
VRALHAVDVVAGTVALADHVGELEVLGLDIALHALHLVDRLLCRVGLELEALGLGQQVEVLVTQLRVEFRQRLVLVLPDLNLALELLDELVLAAELLADVGTDHGELGFERLYTTVILLEHHLVALILAAHAEHFLLELLDLAVVLLPVLLVHLVPEELLLGETGTFFLLSLELGKLGLFACLGLFLALLLGVTLGDK